jgi:hypothetical protein
VLLERLEDELWSRRGRKVEADDVEIGQLAEGAEDITSADVVIPTVDTARHEEALYAWLSEHKPVLLCTGTESCQATHAPLPIWTSKSMRESPSDMAGTSMPYGTTRRSIVRVAVGAQARLAVRSAGLR